MVQRIESSIRVGSKHRTDFIAHAAEDGELFLFATFGVSRVIEWPVMAVRLARKCWASLVGVTTNSDHGFDILIQKLVEVLGRVVADVDIDLRHGFDAKWVDVARRVGAGADNVKVVAECLLQNAFSEVRAAAVAGAEDEDGGHGIELWSVRSGFGEKSAFEIERNVDEPNQCGDFDEGADDSGEGDAGFEAEY